MENSSRHWIKNLIERIGRLNAADGWTDNLNPSQSAALSYLSRANRFSRAPSQVAEFLAGTRGTISQTLKALTRKGLIAENSAGGDRRWISYEITRKGFEALKRSTVIDEALEGLAPLLIDRLADGLDALALGALKARDKRPFGLCKTCRYHKKRKRGGFCELLTEDLTPAETLQICHEHQNAV